MKPNKSCGVQQADQAGIAGGGGVIAVSLPDLTMSKQ